MYDWTAQFSQQRRDYVRRTKERLAAMRELLADIARYPQKDEQKPLRDLMQHFHQLAGSSAIYELEALEKSAGDGERVCLAILQKGGIQKPDWELIKNLIDGMESGCLPPADGQPDARLPAAAGAQLAAQLPVPQVDLQPQLQPDTQILPQSQSQLQSQSKSGWAVVKTTSGVDLQRNTGGWASGPSSGGFVPHSYQKPKDIVIVDGDQTSMMSLTRCLEQAGMQVRGYRTTDGARKAIQERLPDALILGVPLIDSNGYDVALFLRSLPDGNVPPVLVLNRKVGFLDKVMAIRCGADAIFNELSEPQEVIGKLQSLLERETQIYKILSVEDDAQQGAFIKQILESVGYKIQVISDPRQFEEALLAVNPDLLLLDVMLGPVSGFELARFVRTDDRFAATPIIFLTTQNQMDAHVESARVGGDEHLIKPVAPQLLIAAVAGRLERYRVIKKLIGRDALTHFHTLGPFMEAAEKMLDKRHQGGDPIVMLLLDIDHMDKINERCGYEAGDKVIAGLAKLLKNRLRNAEIFARLAGDDFAVIIDGIGDRDLATIATQLIEEFESMDHTVNGRSFRATVSAGAAALEPDMNLKAWLSNAQLALKSAKSGGRNRVMKAKSRSRS